VAIHVTLKVISQENTCLNVRHVTALPARLRHNDAAQYEGWRCCMLFRWSRCMLFRWSRRAACRHHSYCCRRLHARCAAARATRRRQQHRCNVSFGLLC
jgi:hypothetical protein